MVRLGACGALDPSKLSLERKFNQRNQRSFGCSNLGPGPIFYKSSNANCIGLFFTNEMVGKIKYAENWASYLFSTKNQNGCKVAFDCVHQWHLNDTGDILSEVIGNIYENPELEKGEK